MLIVAIEKGVAADITILRRIQNIQKLKPFGRLFETCYKGVTQNLDLISKFKPATEPSQI